MMGPESILAAERVVCGYDERDVLRGVSISVGRGEFVGLIGPNGSGKSTLLRALTGVLPLRGGQVLLDGWPLAHYTRRQIAQRIAVVSQLSGSIFPFTVRDYVMMGRTPYLGWLQAQRPDDLEIGQEAMALTDVSHLADRPITDLSGGELQRATIARAIAQQARILLLDEPTAFLDLNHQHEIFELLRRFNTQQGITVLCVSHDLNLAAQYCPRIVVLKEGAIYSDGPGEQTISEQMVREVYGAAVAVDIGPAGKPRVSLLPAEAVAQEGDHQ